MFLSFIQIVDFAHFESSTSRDVVMRFLENYSGGHNFSSSGSSSFTCDIVSCDNEGTIGKYCYCYI